MRLKLALAVLVFLLLLVLLIKMRKPVQPIEPSPPPNTSKFMMADDYFYRQDDKDWGSDTIGETTDTLSGYGCTISSVAMASSNLLKTEISPGDLNRKLNATDGYTDRGWLIWKQLENVTGGKIKTKLFSKPSHSNIKQCMGDGGYPILKIKLSNQLIHWVVVVGKSDAGYLVRDPLVGQADDKPVPLSTRSDFIYATRCISLGQD